VARKRVILIGFLALLLGVGGLVAWGQYRRRSAELYYSGTIEAIQSNLAFQVSGRVQEVLTDEGRSAEKAQIQKQCVASRFLIL
jgi:multidrug resistance efflux pump